MEKPFLVSLGLSNSLTALVWIAAPLSGMLVQPLVGILSDRSRIKWGRRRPFIIGGTLGVVISMLILAWIENIFGVSSQVLVSEGSPKPKRSLILSFAVSLIYILNISIQPLQAGLRTLIVENCPRHQQSEASAWAGGMTGIGNIIGYLSGFTALPSLLNLEHWTQFQCLCIIASLSLMITTTMSCSIIERDPYSRSLDQSEQGGVIAVFKDLIKTYRTMPARVRKVCHIQFCAWMGWFPFLYYSTTYVGEFYAGRMTVRELSEISIQVPDITKLPSTMSVITASPGDQSLSPDAIRFGTFASFLFAIVAFTANTTLPLLMRAFKRSGSPSDTATTKHHILRLWTFAHLFFSFVTFSTFFVTSQAGATLIVASVGLSWALTLWAPFAIIGNEISALQSLRDTIEDISGEEAPPISRDVQAGAIMGLHNVAISAPQIIAALVSSGIFALARHLGSQNGTGWVLRAGGCATLGAAWLTSRFER